MARVRVTSHNVFGSIAQLMEGRMAAAAAHTHAAMVRKVSTPGPPRSSPGSPPHVDTGDLRKSLQPEVVRTGNTIRGTVSSSVPHALMLEYGTSKMAARPFMRPTVLEERETVTNILRRGL